MPKNFPIPKSSKKRLLDALERIFQVENTIPATLKASPNGERFDSKRKSHYFLHQTPTHVHSNPRQP